MEVGVCQDLFLSAILFFFLQGEDNTDFGTSLVDYVGRVDLSLISLC